MLNEMTSPIRVNPIPSAFISVPYALFFMTARISNLLFGIIILAAITGCAEFDLRKRIPWGEGSEGKFEAPMKIVPFWNDAVHNLPDNPSVRGFGGRILFYGKDPKKTVKVKGTLVVYAFDEAGRDPTNVKPDRKYVYKPKDLEKTYTKNEVGHSYNIWLPWDEVGGPEKEINLIVRFTSEGGELAISEQLKQRLPGMPASTQPGAVVAPELAGTKPGLTTSVALMPPTGNQGASLTPAQQAALQQAMFQQAAAGVLNPAAINAAAMGNVTQAGGVTPAMAQLPMVQQAAAMGQLPSVMTGGGTTGQRMETTTIQLPPASASRWSPQTTTSTAPMTLPNQPPAANMMMPPAQYPPAAMIPANPAMTPSGMMPAVNGAAMVSAGNNGNYGAYGGASGQTPAVMTPNSAVGVTAPNSGLPATTGMSRLQGQAAAAPTQFGAHYVPGTHQVPAWPSAPQGLGPAQWQQFPGAQRFGQPSLPGQGQSP
jgi:hypothetical protein